MTANEPRPSGELVAQALHGAIVEGKDAVLRGLDHPEALELLELLRHRGGEIMGLRPVLRPVVEFPDVLVERASGAEIPGRAVPGDGAPTLVVDASVSEHLEVLDVVALGRFRVAEAVEHRRSLHRALGDAVDHPRLGKAGGLEDRRSDVDDVAELVAQLPLAAMPFGQCTTVPLRVPPQCDAICLVHW